ncbi:MAG: DUF4291 domain-containing protein [Anaerolineae bacterium]|jgi:hypothetical protein|nr:DUF4291 domain-containing protein [Anaerolineae bacterium]
MPHEYEIRADYDADSIVVYQAYAPMIALPALETQRFVSPFSFTRMTWIKPSYLWMMHRSGWGKKPGQEHILAIRITRSGWEEALSLGVLTRPDPRIHESEKHWITEFKSAKVNIQWDPEYTIRDLRLDHRSIQMGLTPSIVKSYVNEWILEIKDYTPLTRKIYGLLRAKHVEEAEHYLPSEQVYPVPESIGKRLGMHLK